MTPNIGDLIRTKDLWIDGKYETIGIFMGFDESLSHGKITYKKMNILLDSGLTFAFVNATEERLCVEVLCRAVTSIEFPKGTLVKFYDAFNSQKNYESLGIVLTLRKKRSDWGTGWMYRVLLESGDIVEIFDYEMRVV